MPLRIPTERCGLFLSLIVHFVCLIPAWESAKYYLCSVSQRVTFAWNLSTGDIVNKVFFSPLRVPCIPVAMSLSSAAFSSYGLISLEVKIQF